MIEKPNEEFLEWIEDLTEKGFYGDLILHFQKGRVDHSFITERKTPAEVRAMMKDRMERKKRPPLVVTIPRKKETEKMPK